MMIALLDMINFVHNSLYVQYGNVNVLLHGEIMILVEPVAARPFLRAVN